MVSEIAGEELPEESGAAREKIFIVVVPLEARTQVLLLLVNRFMINVKWGTWWLRILRRLGGAADLAGRLLRVPRPADACTRRPSRSSRNGAGTRRRCVT
jgi:hypothetical protein